MQLKNQTAHVSQSRIGLSEHDVRLNEMKGMSSYGDILNAIVEDEFELSMDLQGWNKVEVNPNELAINYNQPSIMIQALQDTQPLIANGLSQEFNPEIDNVIQKEIQNITYAPIFYQREKLLGVLQISNCGEFFSEEDAKILKIIAQNLAQFLYHQRSDFFEKINVQRKLEATMISSQYESS